MLRLRIHFTDGHGPTENTNTTVQANHSRAAHSALCRSHGIVKGLWHRIGNTAGYPINRWIKVAAMDDRCVSHGSPQRSGGPAGTETQRPSVIRCGWLRKQGGFVKTWHSRWFVLRGDQLHYYKDEEETKVLPTHKAPPKEEETMSDADNKARLQRYCRRAASPAEHRNLKHLNTTNIFMLLFYPHISVWLISQHAQLGQTQATPAAEVSEDALEEESASEIHKRCLL
ncbi:Rho GTPase-activating protein 24 [Liparis tanakae]|uniref:Rho GTPase-activating protein 24 n=1 Tax=Liparis tanakae TaxID=230148 RepID=A0A4Z2J543_9TELE|nr:Rho GTPase-activating protein 24 [Liparis tanakae]